MNSQHRSIEFCPSRAFEICWKLGLGCGQTGQSSTPHVHAARSRNRTFQRLNHKLLCRSCSVLGSSCHSSFASILPFQHGALLCQSSMHSPDRVTSTGRHVAFNTKIAESRLHLSTRPRRRRQASSTVKLTADVHGAMPYSADLCTWLATHCC